MDDQQTHYHQPLTFPNPHIRTIAIPLRIKALCFSGVMLITILMAIMLSAVPRKQQPSILIQSEAQEKAEHVPWYGQNIKSIPHASQRYSSYRHHLQPHSPTYKQLDTLHYEQQYGKVQGQLKICLWVVGSPAHISANLVPSICAQNYSNYQVYIPFSSPPIPTLCRHHFINNTKDCTSADVVISIPANGELIGTHMLLRYNAIYQQNRVSSTYSHTIWISLNNTLTGSSQLPSQNYKQKYIWQALNGYHIWSVRSKLCNSKQVDKICNNKLKWLFECAMAHEVEVIEQIDMYIYPEVQNLTCLKGQMLGKFPKWIEPYRNLPSTRQLQESMVKMTYLPKAISPNPFTQQLYYHYRLAIQPTNLHYQLPAYTTLNNQYQIDQPYHQPICLITIHQQQPPPHFYTHFINTIATQNYTNYRFVYIHNNNTFAQQLQQSILHNYPELLERLTIVVHEEEWYISLDISIKEYCMGDEIVLEVKEDEWLVGRHALQVINRMFQPDVWLVGTDYLTFDAETRQPARTDRKDGHWVFRKELFFAIDENDLANGQYEHSQIYNQLQQQAGTQHTFYSQQFLLFQPTTPNPPQQLSIDSITHFTKLLHSHPYHIITSNPTHIQQATVGILLATTPYHDTKHWQQLTYHTTQPPKSICLLGEVMSSEGQLQSFLQSVTLQKYNNYRLLLLLRQHANYHKIQEYIRAQHPQLLLITTLIPTHTNLSILNITKQHQSKCQVFATMKSDQQLISRYTFTVLNERLESADAVGMLGMDIYENGDVELEEPDESELWQLKTIKKKGLTAFRTDRQAKVVKILDEFLVCRLIKEPQVAELDAPTMALIQKLKLLPSHNEHLTQSLMMGSRIKFYPQHTLYQRAYNQYLNMHYHTQSYANTTKFCIISTGTNLTHNNQHISFIQSLNAQTYPNYTLKYIDMGSTDNTTEKIKKHIKDNKLPISHRIKYFTTQPQQHIQTLQQIITNQCKSSEVVVSIAGGDQLVGQKVLSLLNSYLQAYPYVWMLSANVLSVQYNVPYEQSTPLQAIMNDTLVVFRRQLWMNMPSQMREGRQMGELYMIMMQLSGQHYKHIPQTLYYDNCPSGKSYQIQDIITHPYGQLPYLNSTNYQQQPVSVLSESSLLQLKTLLDPPKPQSFPQQKLNPDHVYWQLFKISKTNQYRADYLERQYLNDKYEHIFQGEQHHIDVVSWGQNLFGVGVGKSFIDAYAKQHYNNYSVHYTDLASTDHTQQLLDEYIELQHPWFTPHFHHHPLTSQFNLFTFLSFFTSQHTILYLANSHVQVVSKYLLTLINDAFREDIQLVCVNYFGRKQNNQYVENAPFYRISREDPSFEGCAFKAELYQRLDRQKMEETYRKGGKIEVILLRQLKREAKGKKFYEECPLFYQA